MHVCSPVLVLHGRAGAWENAKLHLGSLKWQRGLQCSCRHPAPSGKDAAQDPPTPHVSSPVSSSQIIGEQKKKKRTRLRKTSRSEPASRWLVFLSFSFRVFFFNPVIPKREMRGLLSLRRGLYTLSNRQVRKAGVVGSRCESCGTLSNSKVRFELLLRLGSRKRHLLLPRTHFVVGSDFFPTFFSDVDALVGKKRHGI